MSLRHSKSLNATACTLCVHVSSPLCVRVCAWYSVCVCAYVLACVHETEGRTPRWDCARAGEMRRCMWPSHERALIALEGEIIQLNHHIHPPHDIHHVKLYMVPLEKVQCICRILNGALQEASAAALSCPLCICAIARGQRYFQWYCSAVKAMLTQLATSKIYCGSSVEGLCHRVITVLYYSLI